MDKLHALTVFCSAAETLHFRETALRLSVSPQVVTRLIAELEQHLGEQLFTRNTRRIRLTEFGEQLLPRAQQFLSDGEALFSTRPAQSEMRGIVRITAPRLSSNHTVLQRLLEKCAPYPELRIDWRTDDAKLDTVANRIDIGIRIGTQAEDLMIVRKICDTADKIVAAPAYLAEYGTPQTPEELAEHFPASGLLNTGTNRPWGWPISPEQHLFPKNTLLLTDDMHNELAAALAGRVCAYLPDYLCRPHLTGGALIELFPDLPRRPWQIYLYRPQRTLTSQRVLAVFGWLADILRDVYAGGNTEPA